MLQDKEEVKKRWIEYCSSLYTVSGHSDTTIEEMEQITSPNEDALHEILYVEVEGAVKIFSLIKPTYRRHHRGK